MANKILIRHRRNWGLSEKLVEKLASEALLHYGFKEGVELSLWFVGRKVARDLNIKYRSKDYYPQVLGFPMNRTADGDGFIRLGDVVICTQKLKYEVKFQKKPIEEILREWMIHGVDNLLK